MDRVIHIKRSRIEDYRIFANVLEKSNSVFDILHFYKSLHLTEYSLPHLFFRSKNNNNFDGPKTVHNLKEVVLPHHSHAMDTLDAIFGTFLKCSTFEGCVSVISSALFTFVLTTSHYPPIWTPTWSGHSQKRSPIDVGLINLYRIGFKMEMRHSCAIPAELEFDENHSGSTLILFPFYSQSNHEKIPSSPIRPHEFELFLSA